MGPNANPDVVTYRLADTSVTTYRRNPDVATGFEIELASLLNRHSQENASDTPDFILAKYLTDCLEAWNRATVRRTAWYEPPRRECGTGENPDPTPSGTAI